MIIEEKFSSLATLREPFLKRARENAKLTIPDLFPPDGYDGKSDLPDPNQATGAQGVNNLASKLTHTLLPISSPFFRYNISEENLLNIAREETEEAKALSGDDGGLTNEELTQVGEKVQAITTDLEQSLNRVVESIIEEAENSSVRVAVGEGMKHLIVGGNVLLDVPAEGSVRYISLSNYVVERDGYGDAIHIIIKERITPSLIEDEGLRMKVDEVLTQLGSPEPTEQDAIDAYRSYKRTLSGWEYELEVAGKTVDTHEFELNRLPVIPLRLYKVDGQDYGRAYVSEYRALLAKMDSLEKCLDEASIAKARIIPLVKPNASTDIRKLNEAANLEFVQGDPDDISPLVLGQHNADMAVSKQHLDTLKQVASEVFLINAAFTRTGERVTAAEVRFRAEQLDDALGGIYSILALELQSQLIHALSWRMEADDRLPEIPEEVVSPSVVAGLEALGRNHKLDQFRTFAVTVSEIFGQGVLAQFTHPERGITKIANMLGVDWNDVTKTQEEVQTEKHQARQQELMSRVAPQAANQIGQLAQQQLSQQEPPQPTE